MIHYDNITVNIIKRYGFNEHQVMEMPIIEYLNKASICHREIDKENRRIQELKNKYRPPKNAKR